MTPDSVRRERRAARLSLIRMVLVILAVGALVPWLVNAYWIKTLTSSLALAIAAAGVALLYGQLGLVSLCQYALLGVGGWVALRVGHGLSWPFEACVLAGGLAAGVVGMLAGLPALRLKGLYLALVTLMLAGVCAGVAGALLAGAVGQLDGRAFAASESVMLFALTLIGGAYHWVGALIAGLLLRAVPSLLVDLGVNGFLAMVFFGAALLHALITAPRGLAGQWLALFQRRMAKGQP